MAFFNPLSRAFGLDIGDRTFKVAQIAKLRRRAKMPYRLTAWGSISVPEGVMDKGEVQNMADAAEFVGRLVSETRGLKGRGVVACLPEAKSFVKLVEIEKEAKDADIQRLVIKEIEQNIPLKFDEIYYDWQLIEDAPPPKPEAETPPPAEKAGDDEGADAEDDAEGPAADAEDGGAETAAEPEETAPEDGPEKEPAVKPTRDPGKVRVLIAAAPKKIIDDYAQMLETAGLAPLAFEIEAVAIARAIVPLDEDFYDPIGILDLGATRSSLVIYDEGVLQMSISIPISGHELTKLVSDKFNISEKDAELVKIECGLDATRCEDRMWKIMLPVIDDMSSKIRNALRFYKIGFQMGKKIERLYLCGGGAHFREIDTVLSRKLTIKVRPGDALVNIRKPRSFEDAKSLTYTTAIGLALRAADESEKYRGSFLHI